jgi:hypothetical protein
MYVETVIRVVLRERIFMEASKLANFAAPAFVLTTIPQARLPQKLKTELFLPFPPPRACCIYRICCSLNSLLCLSTPFLCILYGAYYRLSLTLGERTSRSQTVGHLAIVVEERF